MNGADPPSNSQSVQDSHLGDGGKVTHNSLTCPALRVNTDHNGIDRHVIGLAERCRETSIGQNKNNSRKLKSQRNEDLHWGKVTSSICAIFLHCTFVC